jgi:hypothetical protein
MSRRRFLIGSLIYIVVVLAIHVVLFIYTAGYALANDISTEERVAKTAIPVFIINDFFGFPLGLFLPYDPINAASLLPVILIFICNCLIQFSILSFLWRKLGRRKQL